MNMAKDMKRIVISITETNYKKLTERLGTDETDEVTAHVKDAIIQLAGGEPEISREAQRKLDRIAKREAALAEKKVTLAEAKAIENNALIGGNKTKADSKPVTEVGKPTVTSNGAQSTNRHGHGERPRTA